MALAGPPRSHENGAAPRLFSHQCPAGVFCELRVDGVLRSSHPAPSPDPTPMADLKNALLSPPGPGLRVIDIINVCENSGTSTHSIVGSRVGCTWHRR